MGNVVVLQIKHSLGVLNHSTGIGSDEVLDWLGHAILREESSGLGSSDFGGGTVDRGAWAVGNAEETTVGLVFWQMSVSGNNEKDELPLTGLVVWQLDVHKVHLKLSVGLDTDEQRGTSSSSDNLVWEVGRLEDESERAFLQGGGKDQPIRPIIRQSHLLAP